jgi:hypothetical protein
MAYMMAYTALSKRCDISYDWSRDAGEKDALQFLCPFCAMLAGFKSPVIISRSGVKVDSDNKNYSIG